MKIILLIMTCALLLCAKQVQKNSEQNIEAEELLKNGDLEKGSNGQPEKWGILDKISAQWSNTGHPGKCLRLDTSVPRKEKRQILRNPGIYLPNETADLNSPVGAHEGAWGFLPPYNVKENDSCFILSCDVKACSKSSEMSYPQILIRGFQKVTEEEAGKNSSWFHEHYGNSVGYSEMFGNDFHRRQTKKGDWLMVYRHTMACRVFSADTWTHVEMGFKLPKDKRYRPERILFKPYATWPAGIYEFDNISLRRATPEEVKEINAKRPSIRNFQ